MKPWTAAAIVVAISMYAVACANEIYVLTSPPGFEWHVLLRKSYSIVAFAFVGYVLRRALAEHGRPDGLATSMGSIAAYSALIEVGQFIGGSKEGLAWNGIDVLCGALGGAIAVCDRFVPALRGKH